MNNKPPKEYFLISFSDLISIIKKQRYKIGMCMLLAAVIAFFYNATKPIEYQAEGTFKEKHKTQEVSAKSLSGLLYGKDTADDGNAISLLKSRKLAELLVQENGMQVTITENKSDPFRTLRLIKDNLLVEYARFRNIRKPIIASKGSDFIVHHVHYPNEIPLALRLVVDESDIISLFDSQGTLIASGTFGEPLIADSFSLTLDKINSQALQGKEYTVALMPLGDIAKAISSKLTVETTPKDTRLIKISYLHPDRYQVTKQINDLLRLYLGYIMKEHKDFQRLQMEYLQESQKELSVQLQEDLLAHANTLSSGLATTGFTSTAESIKFLATNYVALKQKWLALDMNLQRLESICNQDLLDYEKCIFIPGCEGLQRFTGELYLLKQRADVLDHALRSDDKSLKPFHDSFNELFADLNEITECIKEAKSMQSSLENNEMPSPHQRLLSHPQFVVKRWYDNLNESKDKGNITEEKRAKEGFVSYLTHLIHYLNVHQRNLEEQLSHQQAPLTQFQGVSLATAEELYILYCKELNIAETELSQLDFIMRQLNEDNFEISSLSGFLEDHISASMVEKAAESFARLKDADNISMKEQDRIKYELAIQKDFIKLHLQQRVTLLGLRTEDLQEKIRILQNTSLSLIYEQISILENQIKKYIVSAQESMKDEQQVLQMNLSDIKMDMSNFPQKWAAERIIDQKLALNRGMMEELVKLVKTKDINNNLDMIRTLPVDSPLVPIHPKSPNILLFTILGAILGGFLGVGYVVIQTITRGAEVSVDTLRLSGQHVSGILSRQYHHSLDQDPLLSSDLDTLRRLLSFMEGPDDYNVELGKRLLLLKNQGPNYAESLAGLIAKKGQKTIVIDLCFDQPIPDNTSGLLQYLAGDVKKVEVLHNSSYDFISSGGISRYANEYLSTQKFKELLNTLQMEYDWVIAYSNAPIQSAEAENLLLLFPSAAISVMNETLPQFEKCFSDADHLEKKRSFIMVNYV